MAGNGSCCGHDHVGGDELWMTTEEIADTVFDAVEAAMTALLALPGDASRDERRRAMRSEFDRRRAGTLAEESVKPRTRAEERDERARRRWA
jgi:hypothetical protein